MPPPFNITGRTTDAEALPTSTSHCLRAGPSGGNYLSRYFLVSKLTRVESLMTMKCRHAESEFAPRSHRGGNHRSKHRLPLCEATALARYRDRHQARDGAAGRAMTLSGEKVSTFACPECNGYHLETIFDKPAIVRPGRSEEVSVVTKSTATRKRRYFLVDIENLTHGAKGTPIAVADLWEVLRGQAPGVGVRDHVVIGAARRIVRRYRPAIQGDNVRWVVGADAPDGADRALLAAVDLHRVARDFDELVVASGDHAFTSLALRARRMGLSVQVITVEHPEQRTMLARELSAAAHTHTKIRLSPRTQSSAKASPIHVLKTRPHRSAHLALVAA